VQPGRRRLRWAAIAAATVAALLLTIPAPASAAPHRIGVVAGASFVGDPSPVVDQVVATGARWMREDLNWADVQPFPGVWAWRRFDRVLAAAARRRVRVLPILLGAPCWAVAPGVPVAACLHTLPATDVDFARFAARAAARYGPGGAFWRARPALDARLAPRWFEVWNEPDLPAPGGHAPGATPERYARLVKAAVGAARAVAPGTRWLAAAVGEVDDAEPGFPAGPTTWAEGMVRGVPDIGRYVDALSVHPYPGARPPAQLDVGAGTFANADRIAGQFAAAGVPRPVWITEVGYTACAAGFHDADWCVPGATRAQREERKARWLAQLLAGLAAPRYAAVDAVFVFSLFGGYGGPLQGGFGLIARDGTRLPAWYVFRAAVRRFGHR
jgi:hypothetical protein